MKRFSIDAAVVGLLNNRSKVLLLLAVLTMMFAYGLSRLNIDNDPEKSLPDNIPEVIAQRKIREVFPSPYSVVFMANLEGRDLTEKLDLLNRWDSLFSEVEIDGIQSASGIAHLGNLTVLEPGGMLGMRSRRLTPSMSNERLSSLIDDNRNLAGNFISDDGNTVIMLIFMEESLNRLDIIGELQTVVGEIRDEGFDAYLTGLNTSSWYLNEGIRANFALLLPLAILICIGLLYWIFQRVSFVVVPLVIILTALVWTFGIMGFMGVDFTVLSSVIPLLLFPIGLAGSIHILKVYSHFREKGISYEECFVKSYRELANPIMLSSLTTFFGFTSFAFSQLKWTQSFGVFTGLGVMIVLMLTLIILPLLISRREGRDEAQKSEGLVALGLFDFAIFKSPMAWIILVVSAVFVSIYTPKIKFENNPIQLFNRDNPLVVSDSVVNSDFGGTSFFDLLITAPTPFTTADKWSEIDTLIQWIEEYEAVGATVSLLNIIERSSEILTGERVSPAAVSLVFGAMGRNLEQSIGAFISEDRKSIKISLFMKNLPSSRYLQFSKSIKKYVEDRNPDWTVTAAGPALMTESGLTLLVKTQLVSLSITFFMVALILIILFRSFRLGIFTTIPIVISTLFVAGVMALLDVSINTVTVIIMNCSVGIGIDYAIHFTAGYLQQRKLYSNNKDAIMATIRYKGAVILFNTIAVGVGLLVLVFSDFPPVRQLGFFIFLSMAVSSTFSLLFLPLFLNMIKVKERMLSGVKGI